MPPEQRREQLLDAALELAAADGLSSISIEAIARRAGVTRPVVYSVFDDLGELLQALFEREERLALREVVSAIPAMPAEEQDALDPDEVAVEGIATFLGAVADNPHRWRLILLPVEGTPSALRARVERTRSQLVEQIQLLIAWGVEQRGGPRGLEVELLARAMLALAEEAGRLVLTKPDEYTPERLSAFARGLISQIGR